MTITVAPDHAMTQASAVAALQRIAKAAQAAKVMRFQYFVFFRDPQRADKMAENEGCMASEDEAIENARGLSQCGMILIGMIRIDVETGEVFHMMNDDELTDAVDDLIERDRVANQSPYTKQQLRQASHYDDGEW